MADCPDCGRELGPHASRRQCPIQGSDSCRVLTIERLRAQVASLEVQITEAQAALSGKTWSRLHAEGAAPTSEGDEAAFDLALQDSLRFWPGILDRRQIARFIWDAALKYERGRR